jgi:acyl-CoA thioesterase-1
MNPIVYHAASGHAFFSGVALICTAGVLSVQKPVLCGRIAAVFFLLGVFAVAVSSTPLSETAYAIAAAASCGWLFSAFMPSWRRRAASVMIAVWLLLVILELPYHIRPTLRPVDSRTLAVIGDSVSAGIGGDETAETWPNVFARDHNVSVEDFSRMGETAGSALQWVEHKVIRSAIVVIGVGGNDVLGSTPTEKFRTDLESLLSLIATDRRQVLMFELPLPPLHNRFGQIQREVAHRYNVRLIPKREFLSVLASSGNTLDSLHLTQTGHQRMSDRVWSIVGRGFDSAPVSRR